MVDRINPWKYVQKIDPASLKDNRFVNPPQPPANDGDGADDGSNNPDVKIIDAKDFLVLEDIVCYGSDGKVFERHDKLEWAKDVVRQKDGRSHASFKSYDAILHFEQAGNGLFLPSYACHTVALVALFNASVRKKKDGTFEVINPDLEKVLQQYKNYGRGRGYHNANTIVDGEEGSIIHYPSKEDFPQHGRTTDINLGRRIERKFPKNMNRDSSSLEDALKNATKASYTKDLTGLKDPRILIDIAEYFGKTAQSYPAGNSVCSAWLGCGSVNGFYVGSSNSLSGSGAARGVRRQ